MAITFNTGNGRWETDHSVPRLQSAWPVAERVSDNLIGFGLLTIVGQRERTRTEVRNNDTTVGAHHVSNGVIEEMICALLNREINVIQFCGFIGAMIVPPPSYLLSLPMQFFVLGNALNVMGESIALMINSTACVSRARQGRAANHLADTLSHLHTNLRLGQKRTNSALGGGVDPRVARNAGIDPVAWLEILYQYVTGDTRPRMAAESIYALSMVRLTVPGREELEFKPAYSDRPLSIMSSVDGDHDMQSRTGLTVHGAQYGMLQNPMRRAAHVPYTRYVLPLSWAYLVIGIACLYMYLKIFQSGSD
ncbi:hypothetical protein NY751_11140 [Xanthomonas campestris]|uniref:hypothetical protein n=1 Tax=Xanthomonas campestris TaxID=339 RepID=UPI00235995A3|nr:hypothetical protein [Xanthomonas campestris]MDC8746619.1 hypothetical protein [Xanthomonas campestris]